jgi:hypothetical protein
MTKPRPHQRPTTWSLTTQSQQLETMTMPILKAFLATVGRKVSGKKADLIESIKAHFGGQQE